MKLVGYFPGVDFNSESQFGMKVHIRKFIDNVKEKNIESEFIFGNPQRHMLINILSEVVNTFKIILMSPDCVYSREGPNLAPIFISKTEILVVVEANGKSHGEQSLKEKLYNKIKIQKWKNADLVICVSPSLENYLKEIGIEKTIVIENGFDQKEFSIKNEVEGGPEYTIGYIGGLQEHQNIELMLESFSKIDTECQLNIVGGNKKSINHYQDIADNQDIENINFMGYQEDVCQEINKMDLCLGPFFLEKPSSPLKVYEYLACGREVYISNESGLHYLEKYPGVHVSNSRDPETISDEIESILENVKTNYQGHESVSDQRSWDNIIETTIREIDERSQ